MWREGRNNQNEGHTKSLRERRAVLLVAECRGVWANICLEKNNIAPVKLTRILFDMSPKGLRIFEGFSTPRFMLLVTSDVTA